MRESQEMGDTEVVGVDVVEQVRGLVGDLTDDEAALMRAMTSPEPADGASIEHLFDLVDLLSTIRHDEVMAEYVFAIAPSWDGTVEALLVAGRITTAFSRYELERRVPELVGAGPSDPR
jgi:hypothetical protein